jgi:magnesium transporter
MARTRLYRNGKVESEDIPVDDISEFIKDESAVVWLDVCKPTVEDFQKIGEELGLHALAIEDATSPHERPKLNHYQTHLFMIAYSATFDAESGVAEIHEVSAFITKRALITVRLDDGFDMQKVVDRWDQQADLAKYGCGFLLYGLIDEIVDGHFDVLQALDAALEGVEDVLFEETPASIRQVQRRSFVFRKSLSKLRKVALPMREIVNELIRSNSNADVNLVNEDLRPYYQDVYDHVLRVGEWVEAQRDYVSTILDTNVSVQGNRSNTIMKKVTSWAAIIAVPTAITGFYGQNIPFPGYEHASGFIISSVLIAVLSVTLYITFRRNDWL